MLEKRKANKAEVAEWFGVSVNSVDAWIRSGFPYLAKGGVGACWVFDLRAVAEWHYGRKSKAATLGQDSPTTDPEFLHPKDRKDWYEGEKARVFLEEKKRNLITLDEYREEMARMLKHVAHAFETLPDVLERKCALDSRVIVSMQSEIDGVRSWLADSMEYHGVVE